MTTARDTLRQMAPTYNFTPEEWHYRLAELTTAATVIGLFRKTLFTPGLMSETLVITDEIIRTRAKRWMREVAMARGVPVTLHEPVVERDKEAWKKISASTIAPVAFPVKHPVQAQVKVDGRSSAEGKQRMKAAGKARWARERSQNAHGTFSRYQSGKCRCEPCKEAGAEYSRQRKIDKALREYLNPGEYESRVHSWQTTRRAPIFGDGAIDEALAEITP